jgi:hypothetical protein
MVSSISYVSARETCNLEPNPKKKKKKVNKKMKKQTKEEKSIVSGQTNNIDLLRQSLVGTPIVT